MRSSKSRSRSKSNRPRPLGNIVNRVFDSSGPDGKVRGTPQQIIDKYLVLARDAQISNDRVAAENFLQHAEHYTRLLAEALREAAREADLRRESQEPQQGRQGRGNGNNGGEARRSGPGDANPSAEARDFPSNAAQVAESAESDPSSFDNAQVIDLGSDSGSGLVETPEADKSVDRSADSSADQPEAPAKPAPRRRSTGPRKPRTTTKKVEAEADATEGAGKSVAE